MGVTRLIATVVFSLLIFLSGSSGTRQPCKRMVFYLHDILYNGQNAENATSGFSHSGKHYFTAWLGFSAFFNSTQHRGTITFAGADPLNKTRDISVIGGTGDFFMARGIATLMTDAVEGEVYFRLRSELIPNYLSVGNPATMPLFSLIIIFIFFFKYLA
ncbi:hypothetical protein V6N12_068465 [Hibiscus sabdariffa]|uniref:Dirigent protein n=1 Tax=Hibiscus sabdariffa TaxID=183260 RepID=A0ABR2FQD7_9ROSI